MVFVEKQKSLFIGELAKAAGVKSDSIRFYERSGLLSKPSAFCLPLGEVTAAMIAPNDAFE